MTQTPANWNAVKAAVQPLPRRQPESIERTPLGCMEPVEPPERPVRKPPEHGQRTCSNCGNLTTLTGDPVRAKKGWCVGCYETWLRLDERERQVEVLGVEDDAAEAEEAAEQLSEDLAAEAEAATAAAEDGRPSAMDLLVEWAEALGEEPEDLLLTALDTLLTKRAANRRRYQERKKQHDDDE